MTAPGHTFAQTVPGAALITPELFGFIAFLLNLLALFFKPPRIVLAICLLSAAAWLAFFLMYADTAGTIFMLIVMGRLLAGAFLPDRFAKIIAFGLFVTFVVAALVYVGGLAQWLLVAVSCGKTIAIFFRDSPVIFRWWTSASEVLLGVYGYSIGSPALALSSGVLALVSGGGAVLLLHQRHRV